MIAKGIARKGKDSFGRLARYAGNEAKQSDAVPGWGTLAAYAADATHGGEKVSAGGLRFTNMPGVTTLAEAIDLVELTQGQASKSKADRNYHLVVSFPPGEVPTKAQLEDIEDELVAAIGLADHQRLSAIHTDKDHLHFHVAINKVHPDSLKVVTPHRDHPKLMAACQRLEIKHGLVTTHGDRVTMPDGTVVTGKAADKEAHSGEQSLVRWIKENAKEDLLKAASWAELHDAADRYGLTVKKQGAGMVIATTGKPALTVKASDVDRNLSIKRLQDRLGAYVPPAPKADQAVPSGPDAPAPKTYGPEPLKRSPEAEALWAAYKEEKKAAPARRTQAMDDIRERHASIRASAKQEAAEHREKAKVRFYTPEQKRERIAAAQARRRQSVEDAAKERTEARAQNRTPNWYDYLRGEAEDGNAEALKLLRQVEKRRDRFAANLLRAADWSEGRAVVLKNTQKNVGKDGVVRYYTEDGGSIEDRATHVAVKEVTTGSAAMALVLAAERFDRPLKVEGTDAFKDAVAKAAALPGSKVRFADPEMEERRIAAIREREAAERRYSQADTFLVVPPMDREEAKARGAAWNKDLKRWYVPARTDLEPFAAWNKNRPDGDPFGPETPLVVPREQRDFVRESGARWDADRKQWMVPAGVDPDALGLAAFVAGAGRYSDGRTFIKVDFDDRDEAKTRGARWDQTAKSWYVPPFTDLAPFAGWMPPAPPSGAGDRVAAYVEERNATAEARYPIKQHRAREAGERVVGEFAGIVQLGDTTVALVDTGDAVVVAPVQEQDMIGLARGQAVSVSEKGLTTEARSRSGRRP